MHIRIIAALAGLGLLSACNPAPTDPVKPPEPAVADQPKPDDAAFAQALNFECEGGGKIDVIFNDGPDRNLKLRVDGGAGVTLPLDPASQDGMMFKDATTSVRYDGGEGLTYTSGGATKTCQFKARDLPPILPAGVVRTLMSEDAGKSFEIKVGEKIAVALSGVPTAGYVWAAKAPPAWVKATDGPGGSRTTAQMLPGYAGGNHWETVVFEGVAAGEGEITLAQRRPWEPATEPDADTFKFKLKVS